ncbi:MAG: hypothetical protein LBN94_03400, partial [Puniceicoccales bacterium]|nr:hypothetical protein [Puniceicoccales bacterium]
MCGIVLLFTGGCASIGPSSVKKAHYEYNGAIAQTTDEQLLLNIVRLKYRDNPYFLEVSSVSENRKFTTRIGPGPSKFGLVENGGKHEFGVTAYSEIFQNPTITYTPLQGEKFTQRMVSPVPLAVLLGLMQAGWGAKRVFGLCIERINGLDNASAASGPTPQEKPAYETFDEAVTLIDYLYGQNYLLIGLDSKDRRELVLKFTGNDVASKRLKSLLALDPYGSEFRFSSNFFDTNNVDLTVRTRSLMEVFFYLSHAIDVPSKDIEEGLVTETRDEEGEVFDWSKHASGKWISIHFSESKERPRNAFTAIFYRNKWFYIADNDLNSKSTFMF